MAAAACAILLTCLPALAGDSPAERKADYYYMEAMRQNALGNKDAYYELLRRCHDLDPVNTDVGPDRIHTGAWPPARIQRCSPTDTA